MTNGGFGILTLQGSSTAIVEGTSDLEQFSGGIWELNLADESYLNFSGGGLNRLDMFNNATALLSGGLINFIESNQVAWKQEGDPPAPVWNPHITIECLDHSYNDDTNLLTGHWLDNTEFSISLIDVENYSPAIENIRFVPEPAALTLLAIGGLLIRRRR